MLGDKRFIRTLQLRNLLSFGPSAPPIELGALNALIGPNGSGKSNILEAVDLLRASATDLAAPARAGGGVSEWLWKGAESLPVAELDATVYYPDGSIPLRHRILFTSVGQRFELVDEAIEDEHARFSDNPDVFFYYRYQRGRPVLSIRTDDESGNGNGRRARQLQREDLALDQSVLAQRKDPDQYPEITYLGNCYRQIRLYREWNWGRGATPRLPQRVDLPNDFLAEDASNLGLLLNFLEHVGDVKNVLISKLTQLYEQVEDFSILVQGGTVQLFFREKNLRRPIPAARLSDGTLHFLCLASLLCHPSPPLLICIEEPEIGLHPDILPLIAELLIEASHRTQIIVTTHSDILIDALSHVPDAVLVCEKESNATSVRRLDQSRLHEWLKEYSLGDLWRSGELGGWSTL